MVWVVAIYLLILVPLNWFVFRMLGRVEWAWAAAPLIALVSTVVVIRQAQLDIGFIRARTDIAVAELQPGYGLRARDALHGPLLLLGHAIHVPLSGRSGALVQPFPKVDEPAKYSRRFGESRTTVVCHRDEDTSLTGLAVSANATDLAHSEQMAELGEGIALDEDSHGRWRVSNRTPLSLNEAVVLRRTQTGQVEEARLGSLGEHASALAEFRPAQAEKRRSAKRQRSKPAEVADPFASTEPIAPQSPSAPDNQAGGVDVDPLAPPGDAAQEKLPRQGGKRAKVRLNLTPEEEEKTRWTRSWRWLPIRPRWSRATCGWSGTEQEIPGREVYPKASQVRCHTFVIANLRYGAAPAPQPDKVEQEQEHPDEGDPGK